VLASAQFWGGLAWLNHTMVSGRGGSRRRSDHILIQESRETEWGWAQGFMTTINLLLRTTKGSYDNHLRPFVGQGLPLGPTSFLFLMVLGFELRSYTS
jgi:hypothetical protein